MATKSQNERIIFGLKVKQFRQEKGLSFSELAKETGMSVSYLNEIEKGKKYPKTDKIQVLAGALNVPIPELTSLALNHKLAPISDLLNSNFLNELPLDLFGIEFSKIVEIIANAPTRVGAFISTLVELGRNYALGEKNFYFGVLRSYLELHNNYFEEIEHAVDEFVQNNRIPKDGKVPVLMLKGLLKKKYGYSIIEDGFSEFPELKDLRSFFIPEKKELRLNGNLNEIQEAFQLAKELGFNYLKLKERANTGSLLRVNSFEEVLSHFKANYFAAALLINRDAFIQDMNSFFRNPVWNGELITHIIRKYQASPETLIQRLTNLLPKHFGIQKLFLLRFVHDHNSGKFHIDKELHLQGRHHPHSNGLFEHYCRRWLSVSLLNDLFDMQKKGQYAGTIVSAQISNFLGTQDEYFCITFARPAYPSPEKSVSTTIGILLDESSKQKVRFFNDPAVPSKTVNITCERCPIEDCEERAAEKKVILAREKRKEVQQALNLIMEA